MNLRLSRILHALVRRLLRRRRAAASRPEPAPAPTRTLAVSRTAVETVVGAPVVDLALYERAMTHRSMLRGQPNSHLSSNERLEFLGDAVLGLVIAEHLSARFPTEDEGFLTRLRSKLVNGQALARCARTIDLGALVLVSENMEHAGGRQNPTILADAFEAVIGAVYLDLGMDAARRFIHRTMLDQVNLVDLAERHDNYKSLLLEHVQAQGWPQPRYRLTLEEGPSHDRQFTVEVVVRDVPYGHGTAGSKKKAEQRAAHEALRRLQEEEKARA